MPDQIAIARALIPNPRYDPIRQGGRSSSETLNVLFQAVDNDIAELAGTVADTIDQFDYITATYGQQLALLSAQLLSLTTQLAATGTTELIDFHKPSYITDQTAGMVNGFYGQATAPVTNIASMTRHIDLAGKVWMVDGTAISIARNSGTTPSDSDYRTEGDISYAFDGRLDTAWRVPTLGYSHLWIRVDVPLLYSTRKSNAVTLVPFPLFGTTIEQVWILADGVWSAQDLSYQSGYESGLGVVNAGPVRIFMDQSANVAAIRIKVKVTGLSYAGLYDADVQRIEFGSGAITFDVGSSIADVAVYGKDEPSLQSLVSVNGNQITLQLSSSDGVTSPVVTGIGFERS